MTRNSRQHGSCLVLLFLAALVFGPVQLATAQQTPTRLTSFLQEQIGLEADQLASMERGEAIVKVLHTDNKRDIAVFGVVRISVPREFFVTRLLDFPQSLNTLNRVRVGIFGVPPTAHDVERVSAVKDDLAEVRK